MAKEEKRINEYEVKYLIWLEDFSVDEKTLTHLLDLARLLSLWAQLIVAQQTNPYINSEPSKQGYTRLLHQAASCVHGALR